MRPTYDEAKAILVTLEKIPDPRHRRGVRYSFAHLLLICIYAVLAGYSDATDIACYAETMHDYFKDLLGLEETPSHDTFSRVLRFTSFEHLSENLSEWLQENFPTVYARYGEKKVLHVDGKAVRAASEKSTGERSVYHLNAMYEGESIGLALKRVGDKENEISQLPSFLKQFNLKDTIVTIDAMGCNQTVIHAIQEGGGNYVLPVKENQERLYKVIEEKVEQLEAEKRWDTLETAEQRIKEHGRIEHLQCHMISDTRFVLEKLGTKSFFDTIARIGVIDKTTQTKRDGEWVQTRTRSYIITDLETITVEAMLKIKASHWHIEMQHWLLDIQLGEDRKTARRNDAITNGAILRRFCMLMKTKDAQMCDKPMKRFLIANALDCKRIERLLFLNVAQDE